jgi:predicted permease
MPLYRWLLRWCPPGLRGEFGAAMEDTTVARLAEARARGRMVAVWVWVRELIGLIAVIWSERRTRRRVARRERRLEAAAKGGAMQAWVLDVRQAARRLAASPVFAMTAVLTLGLAIGANVAIFTLVERIVVNPLPYPDAERLVAITHRVPRVSTPTFAEMPIGIYYQYVQGARTLDGIAAFRREDMTLTGRGNPERIRAVLATPSLAGVLGVAPMHGRWFAENEGMPGASRVAVVSHGFWGRRFGSHPSIVGQPIVINGEPTTIVGVMPASFGFPDERVDLWVADRHSQAGGFGLFSHRAIARLRPGVSIADANAELSRLVVELPRTFPGSALALSLSVEKMAATSLDLKTSMVGSLERTFWTLLAAATLLLLVAASNIANLFLVRAEARQREIAVRRALGAGGGGVARYFFAESALIAMVGGGLAVILAWGTIQVVVNTAPVTLPRLSEIALGPPALLYAGVLTWLAMIAFGGIPLLHQRPLASALVEQGRGSSAGRPRHRVRHLLMGAQVAAALVLLIGSGLMIRSFQRLTNIDPGFDPTSTVTFKVALEGTAYRELSQSTTTHQQIIDRLAVIPGVVAASAATTLPLGGGGWGNSVFIERGPDEARPAARPVVYFRAVAPGYFEAIGMRMLRGRALSRDDVERRQPHVVVNEALAAAYFPGQDAIGRRIASSRPPSLPPPVWLTIVGVVANSPTSALAEPSPLPQLFMPMTIAGAPAIAPALLVGPNTSEMSYVVRSVASPTAVTPAARAGVDDVDESLAMADVRTLEEIVDASAGQAAFTMILLGIAGAVALLLGSVGIYGVTAYVVSQRTAEIGVRIALGAEPRRVTASIVGQGGFVALAGISVGLVTALMTARWIESMLYGISPRDPLVFAATPAGLLLVALLACWMPARRASRLNPVTALRAE